MRGVMLRMMKRMGRAAPVVALASCTANNIELEPPKPATRITSRVALALAAEAIAAEGGSPLTPKQLVAMAMQESSLNANAVGDKGAAVGLFQFHRGTWADHTNGLAWTREMPLESFRVAIRYAKRGQRLLLRQTDKQDRTVQRLWSHHNVGNVKRINEKYVDAVFKRYNDLTHGRVP